MYIIQQWVEVIHAGRRFRLSSPMDVRITHEDYLWTVRSDAVGVVGYGDTYQEAMEAFQSDFGDCWDRLVMNPGYALDEHSTEMRESLLNAVDRVDHLG